MSHKSSTEGCDIPWWVWLLILLGLPLVVLLWWLRRQAAEERAPAARIELKPPPRAAEEPAPVPEPGPPTPDDLRRIEGIGPKISGLLQEAGITTFAQLAATDASHVKRILREAGITIADPTTWPEQAGLAAADDWDALGKLQAELKGGRRV